MVLNIKTYVLAVVVLLIPHMFDVLRQVLTACSNFNVSGRVRVFKQLNFRVGYGYGFSKKIDFGFGSGSGI